MFSYNLSKQNKTVHAGFHTAEMKQQKHGKIFQTFNRYEECIFYKTNKVFCCRMMVVVLDAAMLVMRPLKKKEKVTAGERALKSHQQLITRGFSW